MKVPQQYGYVHFFPFLLIVALPSSNTASADSLGPAAMVSEHPRHHPRHHWPVITCELLDYSSLIASWYAQADEDWQEWEVEARQPSVNARRARSL